MKRLSLFTMVLLLAIISFSRCKKEPTPGTDGKVTQYINLKASSNDGSKVSVENVDGLLSLKWEEDDKIYVYDGNSFCGVLDFVEYTNEAQTSASFASSEPLSVTAGAMLSFYYYGPNVTVNESGVAVSDLSEQQGTLEYIRSIMILQGKSEYQSSGDYNVTLTVPFAVAYMRFYMFESAAENNDIKMIGGLCSMNVTANGTLTTSSAPVTLKEAGTYLRDTYVVLNGKTSEQNLYFYNRLGTSNYRDARIVGQFKAGKFYSNSWGGPQWFYGVSVSEGELVGLYTVNEEGLSVHFSKGNLQYTTVGEHQVAGGETKAGTWRFASNQYDIVGGAGFGNVYENGVQCDNSQISETYTGWIDLFGWGTSGYHDNNDPYNIYYYPYSYIIQSNGVAQVNHYGYGPSIGMTDEGLYGTSRYYDWGVYNAISNGGNQAETWRTLTEDEWRYVMFNRPGVTIGTQSNCRFAPVKVNDVKGVIVFSEGFSWPSVSNIPTVFNTNDANWNNINYSVSDWATLENAGCLFLPLSLWRYQNDLWHTNQFSFYWSTSRSFQYGYEAYSAGELALYDNGVDFGWDCKGKGNCVRLVKEPVGQ